MYDDVFVVSNEKTAGKFSYDADEVFEAMEQVLPGCDYVEALEEEPEEEKKQFLDHMRELHLIDRGGKDENAFYFTGMGKQTYFLKNFKKLKKLVYEMYLDEFSTERGKQKIEDLLEDRYDTYIFFAPYHQAMTLDKFIRTAVPMETYRIEDAVFRYHY